MTDIVTQTDFCYTAEQLPDIEEFLDGLGVSYEVFEEDEGVFGIAMVNLDNLTMSKIYEWELSYCEGI